MVIERFNLFHFIVIESFRMQNEVRIQCPRCNSNRDIVESQQRRGSYHCNVCGLLFVIVEDARCSLKEKKVRDGRTVYSSGGFCPVYILILRKSPNSLPRMTTSPLFASRFFFGRHSALTWKFLGSFQVEPFTEIFRIPVPSS